MCLWVLHYVWEYEYDVGFCRQDKNKQATIWDICRKNLFKYLEVSCGKLFWRKWRFKSCWTSIWTNIVNSIRLQQEFISILYSPFSSYTITAVDVSVTLHKPSKPGFQPLASHTSMLSYDEDLLLNMSSRGCF